MEEAIIKKHAIGIEAARKYWVKCEPTGLTDTQFDSLERSARSDGLELRDYVFKEIQGTRTKNANYITKISKFTVLGSMKDTIQNYSALNPGWWIPKYDGTSIAAYYDTKTGICNRVVTIGGENLGGLGIDQTSKLSKYFPRLSNTGIIALQCEALVPLELGYGESSRQKANGLVNSKYLESEVDQLLTFRCFRYYLSPTSPLKSMTYKDVLDSLPRMYNLGGQLKFSGGFVMSTPEILSLPDSVLESDVWKTPTGTFLIDGLVSYHPYGECREALKFKDAGRGEAAEVLGIKWNNQVSKGKDSWSANALITPVLIRGSKCTKPTVGSVRKMVDKGLSKGAKVTVILANSTIPQVSEVLQPGNLDFQWPTCSCGRKLGEQDIFGAGLKCGNSDCSERLSRMKSYLETLSGYSEIDLNKLLVIDRFDWWKKVPDYNILLDNLIAMCKLNPVNYDSIEKFLSGYLSSELQKKTLKLVIKPAIKSICLMLNP